MKLTSALKKEFMYFSRTFRMFGVIFSIMIFALADPVMIKGVGAMMSAMGDMISEQESGIVHEGEEQADSAMFSEEDLAVFDMFAEMDASAMMSMSIGDFTNTAVLIVLLIMMGPSGSEQKKRSIIIPRCAGLTPKMYITPKFLIYPITGFLSGFIGLFVCAGVTSLLFDGAIDMAMLALGAVSVGLYISFVMILQLTLGICTERPGVSVVSVLAAVSLIPSLLSSFRVDKFNPFALPSIAMEAFGGASEFMGNTSDLDPVNVAVSLIVTIILSLILYFTTLFVLTTRQIENEGNEAVL